VCDDGECDGEGRERRGGAARFRFAFSGWHRWEGMPQIFVGDWRLLPLYYVIGLDWIGSDQKRRSPDWRRRSRSQGSRGRR
jgi:hypothetical protein